MEELALQCANGALGAILLVIIVKLTVLLTVGVYESSVIPLLHYLGAVVG